MLDGVFGHHARVGGGTAGDDDNLVDRLVFRQMAALSLLRLHVTL